ncbi:hypothetical protein D1872_50610 [compost metagenome]
MANKNVERKSISVPQSPVPSPRIHLREFLMTSGLSDMEKAAFTAYVRGKVLMRINEWNDTLKTFKGRDEN